MGKLTALEVKALIKPGRYTDAEGLHLHVRTATRRAWVFRYMRGKKAKDMGLGPYPEVTLAKARDKAAMARAVLRDGGDPLAARAAAEAAKGEAMARTFRRAAESLLAVRGAGWKSPVHRKQWASTLQTYASPVFGDRPIQEVDTAAVLQVLQPIWVTKSETASRLRGRIEAVLDSAKAQHWRTGENPARWKGHLSVLLPPPGRVRKVVHMPSLPWEQMGAFMPELRKQAVLAAAPLLLLILTVARAGMVRFMTWDEVDLDAKVWTIPAARMKAGAEHRVPLSTAAIILLEQMAGERKLREAARLTGPRKGPVLVFPNTVNKPLSDMALTELLRRMNEVGEGETPPWRDGKTGEPIVPHGFRSTFRVWAGEQTAYPREVIEAAMAHTIGSKVEAAYQRSDLMEKRRGLMEDWGRIAESSRSSQ